MPVQCSAGCGKRAQLKRPKTGDALCKDCFYFAFETEVHFTIVKAKLFNRGNTYYIIENSEYDILKHSLGQN